MTRVSANRARNLKNAAGHKMNVIFKLLLASILMVFLVGCATYPLNMNKA